MLTKGQSKIPYLNIPKSQRETALDLGVRQTHISLLGRVKRQDLNILLSPIYPSCLENPNYYHSLLFFLLLSFLCNCNFLIVINASANENKTRAYFQDKYLPAAFIQTQHRAYTKVSPGAALPTPMFIRGP